MFKLIMLVRAINYFPQLLVWASQTVGVNSHTRLQKKAVNTNFKASDQIVESTTHAYFFDACPLGPTRQRLP